MPAAVLMLLLLAVVPARAQVLTLGSAGSWTAFGGARQDGQRVCGIAVRGEGRSLHFSYFAENPALQVELFRRSWAIPHATPAAFTLQPGSSRTPVLRGEALPREGRLPARVSATMAYDGSGAFWQALRRASLLRVQFQDGTEPGWTLSIPGSAGAVNLLAECLRRMGAPTGPLEDPAAARPHDSPPRRR
jgi:hypothetical protein